MMRIDRSVEKLIVDTNICNDETFTVLDLSSFVNLKLFEVGDDCFEKVIELKLIGLHALERVLIGKQCFTKKHKRDPKGHFNLKDCERLKELKIGCNSFSDFTVCEIANVPSLEVIEMGGLNMINFNFCFASLELKSDGDGMK